MSFFLVGSVRPSEPSSGHIYSLVRGLPLDLSSCARNLPSRSELEKRNATDKTKFDRPARSRNDLIDTLHSLVHDYGDGSGKDSELL